MIVKICGIKTKETLFCCEKNNVNYFGMIFYSNSPRNITIEKAKELQILSNNLKIKGVGVFVNKDINELKKFITDLNLNFIQLHGDEDNDYINEIKQTGIKVFKKISLENKSDLGFVRDYKDADSILFDYKPKTDELPGGNAKSFDWNILKNLNLNKPWFLSGGVNKKNIQDIISNINPFGVDLSSGVEKELGIKDNDTINNFMDKINYA